MKIVLDSNVYLSGLIFPKSKPALILSLARQGAFEVFCSDFIIGEIRRVLTMKFGYSERIADQFVEEFLKFAKVILPDKKAHLIKAKEDDNRILECAMSVKADFLVTGDKKHILPLGKIGKTRIISPAEFLNEFRNDDVSSAPKSLPKC